MNRPAIKLVCFDLGGVLLRICRSWREGCAAAGLDLRGDCIDDPSSANGRRELGLLYQTGRITCDQYFSQLAASTDHRYTTDELRRIHHAWILGEYQGVGDVIASLHAAGLTTACLSNTNYGHWNRMGEFPAVMNLHRRFASHEMGLHKPDPAIFRAFENAVNHRGLEILFFDDLSENVAAAAEVGWRAVQVDPHTRTDDQIVRAVHGCLKGSM